MAIKFCFVLTILQIMVFFSNLILKGSEKDFYDDNWAFIFTISSLIITGILFISVYHRSFAVLLLPLNQLIALSLIMIFGFDSLSESDFCKNLFYSILIYISTIGLQTNLIVNIIFLTVH